VGLTGAFGPDRLAAGRIRVRAPTVGQGGDQEEASTRLGVGERASVCRCRQEWELIATSVGDGDAEGAGVEGEDEAEVASLDAAVQCGVAGEFRHDLSGALGDAG
jgi:hypothetical protein